MLANAARRGKGRFSLLLLEDGDFYLRDWLASCCPPVSQAASFPFSAPNERLRGRLRLCAKAVFFEPHDVRCPIIMYPLRSVQCIELHESAPGKDASLTLWDSLHKGFVIKTSLAVRMKANGADAPYSFDKSSAVWWFALDYAPAQQFMEAVQPLLQLRTLAWAQQEAAVRQTAAQRESDAKFDVSRLVDLGEHILLDLPAAQVTALVREPGRLVLTQARLYFQALHNLSEDTPVRIMPLGSIQAAARRRHTARDCALEVFFVAGDRSSSMTSMRAAAAPAGSLGDGSSVLFALHTPEQRNRMAAKLVSLLEGLGRNASAARDLLEGTPASLAHLTASWQEGELSNLEYLMSLNVAAGRSMCDISQWPVMPWLIADYASPALDLASPATFRDLSKVAATPPPSCSFGGPLSRRLTLGTDVGA
eukprot:jgi/Mesen1/205/ME1138815C07543